MKQWAVVPISMRFGECVLGGIALHGTWWAATWWWSMHTGGGRQWDFRAHSQSRITSAFPWKYHDSARARARVVLSWVYVRHVRTDEHVVAECVSHRVPAHDEGIDAVP